MTLVQLIEQLQAIQNDLTATLSDTAADAAEVRLAMQPRWPMQHTVTGDPTWTLDLESGDVAVYLADGGQVDSAPYLPGEVAEALGWS